MTVNPADPAVDDQPDATMTANIAFQTYVQQMPEDAKEVAQPEIAKFVRWVGPERSLSSITASEVGEYSEMQSARSQSADAQERLSNVKLFLTYLKKKDILKINLAQHLRIRKSRISANRSRSSIKTQQVRLTKAGFDSMTRQLSQLQDQRVVVVEEIQRAAADGDVRENAPLEAARENQGMIMSKIREIEGTLKMAVVIDGTVKDTKIVRIGSKVELVETGSGRNIAYQLVEPNEASPLNGKITIASPVGAAILGQSVGSEVAVDTPRGSQIYRIESTQ